jgi:hypothetical protein
MAPAVGAVVAALSYLLQVGMSQARHGPSKFNYAGMELLVLEVDLAAAVVAGQVRIVAKKSNELDLS